MGNRLNRIHGLQFWFFFFRSILPLKGQNTAAAQFHMLGVDDAEWVGIEAHGPIGLGGLFDRHRLAGERVRDMYQGAAPFDLATLTHLPDRRMLRIVGLRRSVRHRTRAWPVVLMRRRLAESLMRTLLIVFAPERLEPVLLILARRLRVAGERHQGEVKALVPPVLLRLAGRNALKRDAEPHEAHCKRRQPGNAGTGKRGTVVRAQPVRQAIMAEQPLEYRPGLSVRGRSHGFQTKQIAALRIHHGQRLATRPVASAEPALVIRRPYRVGSLGLRPWPVAAALPARPRAPLHQTMPLQNLTRRRSHRPGQLRLPPAQPRQDLLRTPQWMRFLLRNNPFHQINAGRPAMMQRRARQVVKPRSTPLVVTRTPLVTRLARYPERLAQPRHRVVLCQARRHKPKPLIHLVSLSPCHLPVPSSSERTVTYVNGPFRYLSIRVGHPTPTLPEDGEGEESAGSYMLELGLMIGAYRSLHRQ